MKKIMLCGLAGSILYGRLRNREIDLVYTDNEYNRQIIEKTEALREVGLSHQEYNASWFLPFRFLEIYYCSLFDPRPDIQIQEERIPLKNQDTLNLGRRI